MPAADGTPAESAAVEGEAPFAARWALGLSTAVMWFFLAGLSTLISQAASAAVPGVRSTAGGTAFLLGVLSLVVLLAPALPLSAWWGRERLAAGAALTAFAAGVVHAGLAGQGRSIAAMASFAGASFFLVATVGVANRRAVAGGLAGAFVLRELGQFLGPRGADPGAATTMVVALIAVFGAWCLYGWYRAPVVERGGSFERRAGGLRLRGALALGAILFFELSYGIGARGPDLDPLAAAASIAAAALAWLLVVRGVAVHRHRLLAVVLAVTTTGGALIAHVRGMSSAVVLLALVIAHAAALMLLDRALAPVSGRRSGGNLAIGLMLLAVLSLGAAIGWALAGDNRAGPLQSAGWALIAGIVLVASMHLTPRPALASPALPMRIAAPLALAIPLAALLISSL